MKKINKILLLGCAALLFIVLIVAGLKGWNSLVAPNIGKIGKFSFPLFLGFSFLAGVASFFSPCAFALLPGYVAFYLGSEEEKKRPMELGLTASMGLITFFVLLSAIIILVGKGIIKYLGYLAPAVGIIVIILGLALFTGYSLKTNLIHRALNKLGSKEKRSKRNIYLFGLGYGAASLGCTFPLIFAMVIVPLTAGKLLSVFLSFLVYSAAMSVFIVLVTYLVAWSEDSLIIKMVSSTGAIKKLSGLVLILIGAYLVYYNIFYGML